MGFWDSVKGFVKGAIGGSSTTKTATPTKQYTTPIGPVKPSIPSLPSNVSQGAAGGAPGSKGYVTEKRGVVDVATGKVVASPEPAKPSGGGGGGYTAPSITYGIPELREAQEFQRILKEKPLKIGQFLQKQEAKRITKGTAAEIRRLQTEAIETGLVSEEEAQKVIGRIEAPSGLPERKVSGATYGLAATSATDQALQRRISFGESLRKLAKPAEKFAGFISAPLTNIFGAMGKTTAQVTTKEELKEGYKAAVVDDKGNIVGVRTVSGAEAAIIKGSEEARVSTQIISDKIAKDSASRANAALNKFVDDRKKALELSQKDLQEKVNRGKIGVDEANKLLQQQETSANKKIEAEAKRLSTVYTKQAQDKFTKQAGDKISKIEGISVKAAEKEALKVKKAVMIKTLPQTFVTSAAVTGGITALGIAAGPAAPLVYGTAGVSGAASLALAVPDIQKSFKDAPVETGLQIATTIAGGITGAKVVGGIKNSIEKARFQSAAEQAPFKFKGVSVSKGKNQIVTIKGTKTINGQVYAVKSTLPVVQTKAGAIVPKGGMTTVYTTIKGGKAISIKTYTPSGIIKKSYAGEAALVKTQGGLTLSKQLAGQVQFGKVKLTPLQKGVLKTGTLVKGIKQVGKTGMDFTKQIKMKPLGGKPIETGPSISVSKLQKGIASIAGTKAQKARLGLVSGDVKVRGYGEPFAGKVKIIKLPEGEGVSFFSKVVGAGKTTTPKLAGGKAVTTQLQKVTAITKAEQAGISAAARSAAGAITFVAPKVSTASLLGMGALGATVTTSQLAKEQKIRYAQQQKFAQIQQQRVRSAMAITPTTTTAVSQVQAQKVTPIVIQKQPVTQAQRITNVFKPIVPVTPVVPIVPPAFGGFKLPTGIGFGGGRAPSKGGRAPKRAYQASVAAVSLGIAVSKKQAKRLAKKKFTGLELRPVIKEEARKQNRRILNIFKK